MDSLEILLRIIKSYDSQPKSKNKKPNQVNNRKTLEKLQQMMIKHIQEQSNPYQVNNSTI